MLNTTKIEYFPWFFFWKHSLAQDTIIENLKLLDAKMSIFYSSLFVKFWLFSHFSAFRGKCPFFHVKGPSTGILQLWWWYLRGFSTIGGLHGAPTNWSGRLKWLCWPPKWAKRAKMTTRGRKSIKPIKIAKGARFLG